MFLSFVVVYNWMSLWVHIFEYYSTHGGDISQRLLGVASLLNGEAG